MCNTDRLPKVVNTTKVFFGRQYSDSDFIIQNRLQTSPHFIDRLGLENVLHGHNGCVNCIEWSENGRYLASGSDDLHIKLWDPFQNKTVLNLKTPHKGNIFSVKFLPKSGNSLIASGAADKRIFVFDLNRNTEPIWNCDCHWSRVKRLETSPECPFLFWSAGEDGNILQFDIRDQHKCRSRDKVLLLSLPIHSSYAEAKCIAVNPRRPEYLAVGANDPFARVYDRRMLKLDHLEQRMERMREGETIYDDIPNDCVTYFCPGQFQKNNMKYNRESKAITYLTFNSYGNELLVNIGAEHIYLYDFYNAKESVFLDLPKYDKSKCDEVDETPKRKLPDNIDVLKKMGNEYLENEKYLRAINEYTYAILLAPDCPVLYLNRATALMRRVWYGDVYAALRDCHTALKLDPSYIKAHFRLARALLDLGRIKESEDCLKELVERFPSYAKNHGVLMLKKDIAISAEDQKKTVPLESFITSDLSCEEYLWRSKARDYKDRFVGHCNTTTDIKEAKFFGNDSNYIVAGSDDGNFFIWDRPSNKIKNIYKADSAIVNCVQPHPNICMLATSGIDHEIKIWSPLSPKNGEKNQRVYYIDTTVESNQVKMRTDPFDFNAPSTYCRSS